MDRDEARISLARIVRAFSECPERLDTVWVREKAREPPQPESWLAAAWRALASAVGGGLLFRAATADEDGDGITTLCAHLVARTSRVRVLAVEAVRDSNDVRAIADAVTRCSTLVAWRAPRIRCEDDAVAVFEAACACPSPLREIEVRVEPTPRCEALVARLLRERTSLRALRVRGLVQGEDALVAFAGALRAGRAPLELVVVEILGVEHDAERAWTAWADALSEVRTITHVVVVRSTWRDPREPYGPGPHERVRRALEARAGTMEVYAWNQVWPETWTETYDGEWWGAQRPETGSVTRLALRDEDVELGWAFGERWGWLSRAGV